MPMLKPYKAAADTYVLPAYLPVPGIGLIVINSYLILARQPVLIDTHMPVVRNEFMESLRSLINLGDIQWVVLTHDDGDHSGNLMQVLEEAPSARLVTQFIGMARLDTAYHLPMERLHLLNPGQGLDVGDRTLGAVRPPLFDSPATSAIFDAKTSTLFSADAFGALIPSLGEDVSDIPQSDFNEGFLLFNRVNHPWSAFVDKGKFHKLLEDIRKLQPQNIASCHSPLATGRSESLLKAMAEVPVDEPLLGPDQAAFEPILADMAKLDGEHLA